MKTILDSAAGKDLAGVVWFDAVQAQMGPADDRKTTGQRETAKKVINERISAELDAVPAGASAAAATAALSTGFTFRLYYNASGGYAGAAGEVEAHLKALFGEGPKASAAQKPLATKIAALDPAARAALRARYQTIGVTQTQNPQHDANIAAGKLDTLGHDNMVGSNAFADAIRALPAASSASPSAPAPMRAPTPPKSSSLDSEPDLVPENRMVVASVDRRMLSRVEDVALRLISETVALGRADGAGPSAGHSLLREADIRAALVARSGDLSTGFDGAMSVIGSIPEGQRDSEYRAQAEGLIMMLENAFIHDSSRSAIDLLSPDRAKHFRDMSGIASTTRATPTARPPARTKARPPRWRPSSPCCDPERRPNQGAATRWSRSRSSPPPAPPPRRQRQGGAGPAGRDGCSPRLPTQFERMAELAGFDRIALTILSSLAGPGGRRGERAASGNAMAVAAFSSHSLGLAVDIAMSGGGQHFEEIDDTADEQRRRHALRGAHKWMVLRGEEFGWFPYGNEPWHWEYNPPGLPRPLPQGARAGPEAAPAPVRRGRVDLDRLGRGGHRLRLVLELRQPAQALGQVPVARRRAASWWPAAGRRG